VSAESSAPAASSPARHHARRPWLAALLSLLLPGLGHVYAGRFTRGVAAFAILSLASLVATWAYLTVPPSRWLLALVTMLSIGLLVGVAVDAARLAREAQRPYQIKRVNRWYAYAAVVALGLGLGAVLEILRERFLEPYRNPSAAMANALLVGDWFFVDKRESTRTALAHGAIVVYQSPEDASNKIVKRIVGLPGDSLVARHDTLIRNGRVVIEPYVSIAPYRSDVDSALSAGMGNWGPLRVPPDSVFVLGDNRHASKDSRHVGFISARNVVGKPRLIYYSYDPAGDWTLPFLTAVRWSRLGTMPR
jgi:signal peptidase I